MKVEIKHNMILIDNPVTFDARHILECGQVFRYRNLGDCYEVISLDKRCRIYSYDDHIEILTDDTGYFYNYFDLNTDYEKIIDDLNTKFGLNNETKFGRGIRILNQDPFETLISFIISSNNNIKRIQKIIEKLTSLLGEEKDGYFSFPTVLKMAEADRNFYDTLGAGYRAEYLYKTAKIIKNGFDLEKIKELDTESARKRLMELSGVGPKVADCILLFAYHRNDVFPVDTWITKVYNDECGKCESPENMRKYLTAKFGSLSGYAQQYLFYYKRETDKVKR